MTQEEKQLLLADLSARLPYGVYCKGVPYNEEAETVGILTSIHHYKCTYVTIGLMNECEIETVKPYLHSMSSMTEEERKEQYRFSAFNNIEYYDWLNAHHFDYRGLIEKGLALKAPKEMYINLNDKGE